MSWLDTILNLALLFLWIDWRTGRGSRQAQSVLSLASAVRPVERRPKPTRGLGSLIALAAILLIRPCLYFSIGSKLHWTPEIDFYAFTIPWRSDLLDLMYLFSLVTFLITLGFYYCAVVLFSAVNTRETEVEVMQHFVRLQLGWLDRIPWFLKLLLPMFFTAVVWLLLVPLLARTGLLPAIPPSRVLGGQALALALASLLAWKWVIAGLLLLHLLNVHVYLGTHPVWAYLSLTARKLLRPLRFLSMPKLDLAPVAGLIIVFCVAEFLIEPAVIHLIHRFAA